MCLLNEMALTKHAYSLSKASSISSCASITKINELDSVKNCGSRVAISILPGKSQTSKSINDWISYFKDFWVDSYFNKSNEEQGIIGCHLAKYNVFYAGLSAPCLDPVVPLVSEE